MAAPGVRSGATHAPERPLTTIEQSSPGTWCKSGV
jgi:hypothetical protein